MATRDVMTIGYEGRTLPGFIDTLKKARVRRVIDVRMLPLSRRRGFSKSALGAALAAADIDYLHVKEVGNPFRHDEGSVSAILERYRRHVLRTPTAVEVVRHVARDARAALLCFEADAACCHRSVIASLLGTPSAPIRVHDL